MFDFRLQVFHTVAKRLNFTKAAAELYITQPAVTKHIHEIENHFKVRLFERNGTKIRLTGAGETLLQYTEQLFSVYRNLEFEMHNFTQKQKGTLRIGASTTVAQYILPPILAGFHQKFDHVQVVLTTSNTEQVEMALQKKEIDFGIIEGSSKSSALKYTTFLSDELVLVTRSNNPLIKKLSITIEELKKLPLLMREPGSGTLEVIVQALRGLGVSLSQLKIEMQLASSESMKLYLLNCNCFAFLSKHAITKELARNEYSVIEVKGLQLKRSFFYIQQHGQQSPLTDLFIRYAAHHNLK